MNLGLLPEKERRGSRARCVLLTDGSRESVASRLTGIVGRPGIAVRPTHRWMPRGFADPREVQLDKDGSPLPEGLRLDLRQWWLGHTKAHKTPTWDIVSEIEVGDREGLLLVEAKAHDSELFDDQGKREDPNASSDSKANHERIGQAIAEASAGLSAVTALAWNLSLDPYQLSNRFAWAWMLVAKGVPVVLVYLGFLGATEMDDQGLPLESLASWESVVHDHATGIVPTEAWGTPFAIGDSRLLAVIRSADQALPSEGNSGDP